MRIKKVTVRNLYNNFNYEINLNNDEGITILISPNGFGKTKILEMLHSLFMSDFSVFTETPFARFEVHFDTQSPLIVTKQEGENGSLEMHVECNSKIYKVEQINSSELVERLLPYAGRNVPLEQVSPTTFRDLIQGDTISVYEAISRYSDLLPELAVRRLGKPNKVLTTAIKSLRVKPKLIRTQRLSGVTTKGRSGRYLERYAPLPQPSVIDFQQRLSEEIQRVLALSTEKAQTLDSTFPTRLISKLNSRATPPNVQDQVQRLNHLNEKRREISDLGLLSQQQQTGENQALSVGDSLDSAEGMIAHALAILAEDTEVKLGVMDEIFNKAKLFRDVINKKFKYKVIKINKDVGYHFLTMDGKDLPPSQLSSGEQHELVLLYELLFDTPKDSLVIVDEPELSLHIDWQGQFLQDISQIRELVGFDVLMATHSPDIIQGRTDLAVDLGAMVDNYEQ